MLLILTSIKQELRTNFRIRGPQVMVIDEENKQLGVLPVKEALILAQTRGLDLVEVGPTSNPPVCRILDWGAYQYRLERQQRKQRAKTKQIEVKGVRLSLKMGQHDRDVRLKQARKFLLGGDKVKLEMIFRGRENAHRDLGQEIMEKFVSQLGATVEQSINRQGNKLFCLVGGQPKPAPEETPAAEHATS